MHNNANPRQNPAGKTSHQSSSNWALVIFSIKIVHCKKEEEAYPLRERTYHLLVPAYVLKDDSFVLLVGMLLLTFFENTTFGARIISYPLELQMARRRLEKWFEVIALHLYLLYPFPLYLLCAFFSYLFCAQRERYKLSRLDGALLAALFLCVQQSHIPGG